MTPVSPVCIYFAPSLRRHQITPSSDSSTITYASCNTHDNDGAETTT